MEVPARPSRLSPSTAAEDEGLTPSIFSRARAAVAFDPSKKYLVRRWGSSDRNFLMRTLRTLEVIPRQSQKSDPRAV